MLWLLIISLVLLAATWVVVLVLHLSPWIAIGVTAFLLLVVATFFIVRAIRARLRANALERELMRQAEQQAAHARPDRRHEILALQAHMKSAFAALKRSKLGKGGRSALYTLPWYAIVGPPAAGKTTALSQSGLGFITPPGAPGSKLRGTAGTKNCDWWFSQRAILLDTAGRLATEEDDHDEWQAFLDTLRRFRPERPLDGVVVAVSVEDLLGLSEDQAADLFARLRSRVDELCNRLDMVLPVYVMVTKVDLVAGFVEFWGDLGKTQRGSAWGASFRLDDERVDDLATAVEEEFELLLKTLHAHMIKRLAAEPLPAVRARVLQFPTELAALRAPVAHLAEVLGRPNPYQETPFVRGFYLSSGTQTGRAIDRVLGNMARGFDLRGLPGQESRPAQTYSFFVTDLFAQVIFPDRHLAVRSLKRMQSRTLRQVLVAGIAVIVTLTLITPATVAYLDNTALISDTQGDVAHALTLEHEGSAASTAQALDLLLARTQRVEDYANQSSVRGLFGMYTAKELEPPLARIYLERLRAMVEQTVEPELVGKVRAIGDMVRMDMKVFQTSYDDLKLYVMLTDRSHLSQEFAADRLATVWARALRSDADRGMLSAHAKRYIAAFAADPSYTWPTDHAALARAQGRFTSLQIDQVRLGWLTEAARGAPPIRAETLFYGPGAQYVTGRVEVPGVYTKLGWEKVSALLESKDAPLDLEAWVVGKSDQPVPREELVEQLKTAYFRRYGQAWLDFLRGLEVQPAPPDVGGARAELSALAENDGPYRQLFRALSDNLRLDMGPTTLAGKLVGKVKSLVDGGALDGGASDRPVSSVERQFQPLLDFGTSDGKAPAKLDQYLVHLSTLEEALKELSELPDKPSTELSDEFSRKATAVGHLLSGMDVSLRGPIEPLLMAPIRGASEQPARQALTGISDAWKTEVWETYDAKIRPRYPFADSPNEVSLPEFADFFRPETGAVAKFFKANLESFLQRSGNAFVPRDAANALPFRADFLRCLGVAQEITDAVFGNGADPSVPFSVRIHPAAATIAEIALVVDGQATVYRNEPERWVPTAWPGKGDPHGATLQVRGEGFTDEIPRMGDFGLFRLLAAGGIKPTGQLADGIPTLAATFSMTRAGDAPVHIEFKPSKTPSPFTKDFFARLKCPAETTAGLQPAPQGSR